MIKVWLLMCVIVLLAACSNSTDYTKIPQKPIQKPNETIVRKTLDFEIVDTGSSILSGTASVNSTTKNYIEEKLELTEIDFNGSSLYVADFRNALLFEHDRAIVHRSDLASLSSLAKIYNDGVLGKFLYVIGHTDSDGSAIYNYSLSARRARSVASILLRHDLEASKVNIVPAGEHLPKASNRTSRGKQINRRVEIISADSKALIQSYIRQLECPPNEACNRKLLNVFEIRRQNNEAILSLNSERQFAINSPELNDLPGLNSALKQNPGAVDSRLLAVSDERGLLKLGVVRSVYAIPVDIRKSIELPKDKRKMLVVPNNKIIN